MRYFFFFLLLIMTVCFALSWEKNTIIPLSKEEARRIGMQIWRNECSGKKEGLTSWNDREEFASLGIGHFIWYPQGQNGDFKETFPQLVKFMQSQGVPTPIWLTSSCPWSSRKHFQEAQNDPLMLELREWLYANIDAQIQFIINRLHKALPAITKELSSKKKSHIMRQFHRLTNTPAGLYVLIDYLNFKGEGISPTESYQGYRWGLLQVLSGMKGKVSGHDAIKEFVESAKHVLNQRIAHSPPHRAEDRWREGWFNRLDTYLRY